MSYLSYISDEELLQEVKYLLDKGLAKKKAAERDFNKNVIDPFGSLFESAEFPSHEDWKSFEMKRQLQKTIQNHVGTFHQKILGSVEGWSDLGTGAVVDLVCEDKKIIAELKNKYNTLTGGKLADQYHSFQGLISPKHSRFKDYTAYFVNIIPKKPQRIDQPFTPSNKETGQQCPVNDNIRIIDGSNFYEIVTGRKDALRELHEVLPVVIKYVYNKYYKYEEFEIKDLESYKSYFDLAYGK